MRHMVGHSYDDRAWERARRCLARHEDPARRRSHPRGATSARLYGHRRPHAPDAAREAGGLELAQRLAQLDFPQAALLQQVLHGRAVGLLGETLVHGPPLLRLTVQGGRVRLYGHWQSFLCAPALASRITAAPRRCGVSRKDDSPVRRHTVQRTERHPPPGISLDVTTRPAVYGGRVAAERLDLSDRVCLVT